MCENSYTSELDWDDLRMLLAVARAGRLTTAARRLGLDHSTLSKRIAGLESSLGVALFERSPSGYKITETGQRLVEEVQQIENSVIRIHTLVASESRNLSGPIRLTLPEGFSTAFFVDSLQKLRENSPEISIELIADPSIVSLTKREADIAIMMERPNQGPLVSRKLCDYEYGLYCSKDYIDSAVDLRLASDLEKHFIIGYIPDLLPTPSHNYLKDFFNDKRPDLQISNILTQVEAAARGLGLAFLPCFMASRRTELIRLLADEVNFIRAYWIVTHEDPRYPSRTARVKDFIIEQVQQNGPSFRPSAYRQRN